MKEFFFELLQAVATAAIPVCAAFLIQFLRRKSEEIGAKVDSMTTKELLDEVTDAVTTAVTYTSQTYVDALKKGGIFDKEAQMEALQMSMDKTLSLLSASAKEVLAEIYGDLDTYLVTKIEAEVRAQKQQTDVITLGEPFTSELKDSTDVTSVAAATAAATAAVVVQNASVKAEIASAPAGIQTETKTPQE